MVFSTTKVLNVWSAINVMSEMKLACQNLTHTGIEECGLKVGAKCVADRSNTFIITPDFIKKLKVVGCKSYSKYMEWTNDNTDQMPGVQKHPVEQDRRDCNHSIPERSLGEEDGIAPVSSLSKSDNDGRRDTGDIGSTGHDIMRTRITCMVCGIPAVAMGSDGIYLCAEHHERKKAGKSIGKMMDEVGKDVKSTM